MENSLRRLGTDWIDLYQIHRPEADTDIDETLGALTDLVRAGKVRYIGSSTFPAEPDRRGAVGGASAGAGSGSSASSRPYSILVRGVEADVLPTCQRYGMGVIPWSPLAGGWLTGRYRKGVEAPASHRARAVPARYDMSSPGNQRKLEAADALAQLAEQARDHPDRDGARLRHPPPCGDGGRSSGRGRWSSSSHSYLRPTPC